MPVMNNTNSEPIKQIIGTPPNCEKRDPTQPEFQREITQTDHLNKKLLTTFLGKLNENQLFFAPQNINSSNDNNEFQ